MGFDLNRFADPTIIGDDLFCRVCELVVEKPIQVNAECEHIFCETCFQLDSDQEIRCPVDHNLVFEPYAKRASKYWLKIYEELEIKCRFHENNCPQVIAIGGLYEHELSCEYGSEALLQSYADDSGASLATLTEEFAEIKSKLERLELQMHDISVNTVPSDFVYTQLPSQPEPRILWPTVEWEDISGEYEGLFFRVLGPNSAPFGCVQDQSSPQLLSYPSSGNFYSPPSASFASTVYYLSADEVRPRNNAIRVWKRL